MSHASMSDASVLHSRLAFVVGVSIASLTLAACPDETPGPADGGDTDAGVSPDSDAGGNDLDAGDEPEDGGAATDGGAQTDAGARIDAGPTADAGVAVDAGSPQDAGACWGTPPSSVWPGDNMAVGVDDPAAGLAGNASGLVYLPGDDAMWGVNNGPPRLNRLVRDAMTGKWINDPDGWSTPRDLRFPDGDDNLDTEGVTVASYAEPFVFICSEKPSAALSGSTAVLRYDVSDTANPLDATNEWDISYDLVGLGIFPGSNSGLEAITFIPDDHLVAGGFLHEESGELYDPADYPGHSGGLFIVGVEANGRVFAYALMLDGSFERIAEIESGFNEVMSMEYDREHRVLWIGCDNNCDGALNAVILDDDPGSASAGTFVMIQDVARPTSLANSNLEGIAFGPIASGTGGMRSFFWFRDGSSAGATLMEDTFPTAAPCR